jgi:hypothetical protein
MSTASQRESAIRSGPSRKATPTAPRLLSERKTGSRRATDSSLDGGSALYKPAHGFEKPLSRIGGRAYACAVAAPAKTRRPSVDAVLSLLLFVGLAGHLAGVWQIPQLRESSANSSGTFDPHAITVAFARVHSGAASPCRS